MLTELLLLCRPGFEKECAGEIMALASEQQFPAYIQTTDNSGVVRLVSSSGQAATGLFEQIGFRRLIFARQWFAAGGETRLPEDNRLPDILQGIKDFATEICDIELCYADTNEGKALNKFCRQFRPHLLAALKKQRLLSAHSPWRLHLFFHDSTHVRIGLAPVDNSSPYAMGIPRLKMPAGAPSRSTLKLDEAIQWFLSRKQQEKLFKNGMHAVDLGAAPGGWSWQLVQRGLLVTAIDNGPMQDALMKTGMVEHYRNDAFTFAPKKTVDWLVCDMAERPLHVSRLIARWFSQGLCRHAIFNLKLPMKKRLASVQECIALLEQSLKQAGIDYRIQAKQLYHDREEITVCITTV
ncbi:MAG TPA: 23S rRNA (cytidine(2498)-2'-O)-methyltransferase RlmM [Gammaproteobacteria bacterium]|nr:23S rRNA (cytidine(2498)-2'-O)-methyltransferase RlmM [Gammaproteobacteria bacterium]